MTVDETVPLGTSLVSSLDDYIREDREEINDLWEAVGSGVVVPNFTAVNMASGATSLVAGTEIDDAGIEVLGITADAAVNLTTMESCKAGAIKVIVALDNNVTIVQTTGSTTGGTFFLNNPDDLDINLNLRDALTFVNLGGDGVSADGYWMEIYRKIAVS